MCVDNVLQYPPMLCSRCSKLLDGPFPDGGMTAGYYDVRGQGGWAYFAKTGERFVCDACMWADPAYKAIYGVQNA
jgi:hypothetical protein